MPPHTTSWLAGSHLLREVGFLSYEMLTLPAAPGEAEATRLFIYHKW